LDEIRYIALIVAKQRTSYAWALHLEVADVPSESLSAQAQEGLSYADGLAEEAQERSQFAMRGKPLRRPLIDEIVEEEYVSITTVRRRIRQARLELFGTLTDSGIYKRLQRRREREQRRQRWCEQSGCREPLPRQARPNRRYCVRHRAPAARVRRHRRRRREQERA
jgi:hypothetical protein